MNSQIGVSGVHHDQNHSNDSVAVSRVEADKFTAYKEAINRIQREKERKKEEGKAKMRAKGREVGVRGVRE